MKKAASFLLGFRRKLAGWLVVPKCISCGAVIPAGGLWMCDACAETWIAERRRVCPTCGNPCDACVCVPELLRKADMGLETPLWCAYYLPPPAFTGQLIYHLKRRYDRHMLHFAAIQMAAKSAEQIRVHRSTFVVTYAPRGRASVREYGFDQSKQIAREIAAIFEIPCLPALRRVSGGIQKNLGYGERMENADSAYEIVPKHRAAVHGRRVLLIDDVMTSGATLASCARLLHEAGALSVLPVTLLKVP